MTPIAFCQPPCMDEVPLDQCKCNPKGSSDIFPQGWQKHTCILAFMSLALPLHLLEEAVKHTNHRPFMATKMLKASLQACFERQGGRTAGGGDDHARSHHATHQDHLRRGQGSSAVGAHGPPGGL